MHLNNVLEKVTILPWVGNYIYFCLGSEMEEYNIKQYVCFLSTKFGE